MKNKSGNIVSSLKCLLYFGKIFSSISFSIVGRARNRKAVVTIFDKIARFIYVTINVSTFFYTYHVWIKYQLKLNFLTLVGSLPYFIYMFAMPFATLFAIFRWKETSGILFRLQNLCWSLETKNIKISYAKIRKWSLILICLEVTYFVGTGVFNSFLNPPKFILYCLNTYSTIAVHCLSCQYIIIVYILKHLIESFYKYIHQHKNYGRIFLKEIIDMKNDFLSVGNFISQVYGIITVTILCASMTLALSVYFITFAVNVTQVIVLAFDALLWNLVSLGEIITLIALCESAKKEVGLSRY